MRLLHKRHDHEALAESEPDLLRRSVTSQIQSKRTSDYKTVGKSVQRIDQPKKIMAKPSYLQDVRLPGMVFGRVVRPPAAGARLLTFDESAARRLPGVVAVVREGSFLAVAAAREEQAISAMRSIKAAHVGATLARTSQHACPCPRRSSDLRKRIALSTFADNPERHLKLSAGSKQATAGRTSRRLSLGHHVRSHSSWTGT